MKQTVIINGIKIETKPLDLDGGGKTGSAEKINKHANVIPAKESSEMGEALYELNKDDVTKERLTGIDFRSRIDPYEVNPMVGLDAHISMGYVPQDCGMVTRSKMRKSVSVKGLGRKEIVDTIVGKKEADERSIKAKAANLSGMGER